MKDWFNNRVPPRNRKPHHQFSLIRLAPRLTLATVVAVTMFAPQALAQQRSTALSDVRSLAPNEILRNLRSEPDKTHFYKLEVEAQKFVKIVVEQQGTDLSLTVQTPQKTLYRQIDNPNGLYGPETVSILASQTGSYEIVVYAGSQSPSGKYELRIEGPYEASSSDRIRLAAEQVFAEAQLLRSRARAAQILEAEQLYNAAINKYNEALVLFRQIDQPREQSYSLTNMARAWKALAQLTDPTEDVRTDLFDRALNPLRDALSLLRDAGDVNGEAFVLNEIGAAYRDFGDPKQALASYDSALKLRRESGDKYGQAQLYNNIGLIYSNMGAQPTALQMYAKAMPLWRELSALHDEMNTRLNEGKANAEMGESMTAFSQFQEVLVYCENQLQTTGSSLQSSAKQLKPFALNGIALVHTTWANPDAARENYKAARELFRANGNRKSEADVLDNLGLLHAFLSDTSQALAYFQDALLIRQQFKDPKGLGLTLSNIGFTYGVMGKHREALTEFDRALPLNRQAGDKRFEAYTLVWIGMAHVALNEPVKALEYYEKALAIQQDPLYIDLRGQAITLDKMGEALARSGNLTEARNRYERALERWTTVDDDLGEALTLHGIAKIERDRHNLANARDLAEKAIRLVELLRYRVSSYQLQTTYFANQQDLYALGIDVRMQLFTLTNSRADLEAALSLSEQARARNLLDSLAGGRTDPNKLLSSEEADTNLRLEQQIAQLRHTLLRLRSIGQHKDAAIVEQKLAAHIKEQDDLLSSARNAASRDYDRIQSRPLAPQEIQQLLDDNTVLLQYSLDDQRSHLWKLTRTDIKYFPLPGKTEIETAANQVRRALVDLEPRRPNETDPEETRKRRQAARVNFAPYAANLSRLILNDVAPQLGNKRVVIVADGALLSIPFEALPLPESVIAPAHQASNTAQRPLLLESNEIVYQPSASALAVLRRIPRPNVRKTVAVLADPVLHNNQRTRGKDIKQPVHVGKEKLTRSLRDIGDSDNGDFTLEPLEFSRQEAKDITALAPRGTSMMAVGFDANRRLATSPTLKQFSIVHFATHGILNDKNPELSGLVLSMFDKRGRPLDGYLTLRDIYNLDLPVHLVVVSACQTGVGKPVRGEGIIALTRGFMNAGAQSVVVSLWRVEDEATAELMKRFYTHMFGKNSMSAAAALRQAKLEMKDEYHPYQWAGFVLQGDWK